MDREKLIQTVTAAQRGDNNAISALFSAYQNTVYNIALRETKDPETAADVTQETFIEVIQTIGKLQEPAAFVNWVKTIVYHQCTRYYRKKENKHESLVEEREDAPGLFDTLEEENTEFIPDKAMESEEFRKTIRAFIDKLPDVQRSAIMMKYFDDLSVKEIAAVQGVSENTVLSRLYYGRNAIKAEVEAYEKRHDTKLHAIPFLPLFRFLFNEAPTKMPPVAAAATAKAVGAATGVSLATAAATTAGAATAAGVATTVGTAAVAGTVKAATIPLAAKIAAGIVAASVAITAPIVVTRSNRSEGEQAASASTRDEDTIITTKPAVTVPADAVEYNGHYYKLYDESIYWDEAKSACEELGGHLATITTAEEQAFLNEQLATAEQNSYWIGGVKVEDEWQWLTGETFDYTNWKAGEPNGYGGVEDRISVIRETGRWNDAPDDGSNSLNSFYDISNYGYICEWDSGRLVQATTTTAQPTRYTKRIADYVFEEIGTTHLTGGIGGVEDGTIFLGFLKKDGPGGATVNCTYDPNLYTENHGLSVQSVYNQATDTYDWYFVSYDQAFLNSIQTGTVYLEMPPNEGDDLEW